MRSLFVIILATLASVACASGQNQPANSGPSDAESGTSGKDSASSSIDSQREPFIQGCVQKAHAEEYCACAFEEFRIVFRDADLSKPIAEDDPRLASLQKKTVAACASKIEEKEVERNFMEGCVDGEPRKQAYCDCAWTALRKNLSLSDFLGDGETLRFFAAKKQMVGACKGKFPVELAQSDFMQGCTKEPDSSVKACSCLWKKVHARFSAEEIAAGTADLSTVPELSQCK
jgi:hypothetical protein